MSKHTDGSDMISERPDDNSEVVESPKAPAEALRQQIDEHMRETFIIPPYSEEDERYPIVKNYVDSIMELVTAYAATVEREAAIKAQLRILKHFGFPKELTRKGLDDIWQLTSELEAELARLAALQGPIQGDAPDHSEPQTP